MKRQKNSFQREAFKTFYEELIKSGSSLLELKDQDWVKDMLIDRLNRHGLIDETSNSLKDRLGKNRSHIIELAREENYPIMVQRDAGNGIIEFYVMFDKLKLSPDERHYMEELSLREIDYKVTKEKISVKALERLCDGLVKNGILTANNEKIQELKNKRERIELALTQ